MKIAYISDERFPSVHTDTQQVIKTIDALGQNGVDVDFIQPRMLNHLTKGKAERKKQICEYYNVNGHFNLRDILLWPASDARIEKIFHGLAAPVKAALGRYDVVYTRNIMPLVVATRLGAPVLFETYRAIPLTEPLIWSIVKRSFKKKNFIGISTHSEYSRQVMIDHGAPVDKIWAIPNGYDPSDFDSTETRDSAREKLKLDLNTDIAVYTGHIREDKGVHSLLDMAEEFSGFTMLIVGGNPQDVKSLNKVIIDRRLNNVKLTGQVSINKVPLYLAAADVLILPPSSIPLQKSTVLPMKTFTYMAAGRPILAPDLPDTAGVLNKDVNCLKVTPDNIPQAVETLKKLITDSKLADRLARQAGQDVKKYTWDGRAKRLLSCLEPVIGRH